jgi:hypothetical protein
MFQQRGIGKKRISLLHSIESKRGTRVISLIHRQEGVSFLGIPFSRYINVEDSEQYCARSDLPRIICLSI